MSQISSQLITIHKSTLTLLGTLLYLILNSERCRKLQFPLPTRQFQKRWPTSIINDVNLIMVELIQPTLLQLTFNPNRRNKKRRVDLFAMLKEK